MIEHVKKKLSKRELYERDGFTKHGRAKPYKRDKSVLRNTIDSPEYVQHILDDLEQEDSWLDVETTD